MSTPRYRRSRFDQKESGLLDPLANLADVMLVFAVGLIVALAASQRDSSRTVSHEQAPTQVTDLTTGREVPDLPAGIGEAGNGYEAVGQVYRDRETGRLIMMSAD